MLYEYIHRSKTPEQIDERFWSINLEQVYATILYYLHNKDEVQQYVTEWIEFGDRMREEQEKNPPPVILKLRQLQAELREKEAQPVAGVNFDADAFQDQIIYLPIGGL